jgi:anti-repressor protein
MNQLQKVFSYGGNQVRTVLRENEVWFLAMDVCKVLEIRNPTDAVKRLDDDEVTRFNLGGLAGEVIIINEAGLYSLIIGSKKKEAKQFKRWITHEVIPSIRKTGSYSLQVPQSFAEALRLAADLQEENERNRPKVEAHDKFISGENYQKMGQVAKVLGVGRNKLFAFLRENKIFMGDNTPYQRYIERGYFVVKEKPIEMGSQVINKPQTFVTSKGVDYISKLLDKKIA